jgi:membrane-bound acyltransferase YfiQ involved in biofilm formation
MSFALYLLGVVIFVAGVAWALSVAGISHTYIGIAVVMLVGLGIFTGVTRTRTKDVSGS